MILGERICLRAIEMEDLPLLVKWRNDPQVYDNFYEHEPLSLIMQQRWFEKLLQREDEKFWIAETLRDPEPIGTIALVHIDWRNRKAEMGRVLIFPDGGRGAGYGKEMCNLLLKYAFEHMNLNRIYLEVFADNYRAIEFYKQMAFSEEGRFRQHIFSRSHYRDVLVFSILQQEYINKAGGDTQPSDDRA